MSSFILGEFDEQIVRSKLKAAPPNCKRYSYTVKDNRLEQSDYYRFFDNCEKQGCNVEFSCKELDKKGKLHYHGTIVIPDNVYRKSLLLDGLHLKLKLISDLDGWIRYCFKEYTPKIIELQTEGKR